MEKETRVKPRIDPNELMDMTRRLIATEPGLGAELFDLFWGENAAYEAGAFENYLFGISEPAAHNTNDKLISIRILEKMERLAILCTLKKRDGSCWHFDSSDNADIENVKTEIEVTPEMIAAGGNAIWPHLMHDPLMSPGAAEDLAGMVLRAVVPKLHRKNYSDRG